jgi:ATP-binding cassette subfamily G (WHITE) protein 2
MKIHKELNLGIPRQANAPELFLDLCDHLQQSDKIQVLTSRFIQSESKNLQPVIVMPGVLARGSRSMSMANFREVGTTNFANSLVGDVIILSQRTLTNILRTKELFLARFGSTIFFSVLAGTLFLNPRNDSEGITIKASYFILGLAYFYWTSLEALPIFFDEREIFQREFSGGSYRALSYTISSSIIYFPFLFMLALVFVSISWFLVNLPNDLFRFLFQVLLMFVVLVSGTNFSTMISVIAPDPMTGQTIGSAVFSIMFLFSGMFCLHFSINTNTIR